MADIKPLALIIEDDAASAEALAFLLSDWGAEVLHAQDADGVEAAAAQRAAQLRWIITDFHLGDGPNGVSIVRELTRTAPQARVLVLSGSFHGRATAAAAEAGFAVMHKPARAQAILAWLEQS